MTQQIASIQVSTSFKQEADNAILALLTAQYRACGVQKNESVLRFISERITKLDGTVPSVCVGSRRIEAISDLTSAAIGVVRHLDTQVDPWFATCISSALSDAYKMATGDKILGATLVALGFSEDDTAKDLILRNAVVTVDQYMSLLLNLVPLAYHRNPVCGLWLSEKKDPIGRPLQNLKKDLDRLVGLLKYLNIETRLQLGRAHDLANLAFTVRTDSPLAVEQTSKLDVNEEHAALGEMIENMYREMLVGREHSR